MGFSASQVRFLALTSRKHDIEGEEMHLSHRRSMLVDEMDRVSLKYQNAISSKVLKLSLNSGVNTVDLSYNNLMTPNGTNNYKPYILVNSSNKVVLNDKYAKYAEMISPNGNPVSDWSAHRNEIIAGLTGISKEDLDKSTTLSDASNAKVKEYEELREKRDKFKADETKYGMETLDADKIMNKLGSLSGGTTTIKSLSELNAMTDSIYNSLSKYFIDDKQSALLKDSNTKNELKKACDRFAQNYSDICDDTDKAKNLRESKTNPFTGSAGNVKVDIKMALEEILGGLTSVDKTVTGENKYNLRDTESAEWQNWYKELQDLDNQCVEMYKEVKSAINNENQIFTAAQESEIKFYDMLFTAIAENGWVHDECVGDNDYLNQMMQNNEYQIMTMTENTDYEDDELALDYGSSYNKNKYDYSTDIASNCTNIVSVNDKDAANRAQAEYEHEKNIIQRKEDRIDERMGNLDTELKSINEILKGLTQVANDNIQRHMNITG